MRLKIDLEIPTWTKWLGGLALGVIVGVIGARVYADTISIKTNFANGETLSATEMNTNFKTLQDAVNQAAPPGTIVAFGGPVAPLGWLACDGTAVGQTTYPALYAAIGTVHGSGDGASTFNLPDYRGRFLRGVDGAAENDPDSASRIAANPGGNLGNKVGSIQDSAIEEHEHLLRSVSGVFITSASDPLQYSTTGPRVPMVTNPPEPSDAYRAREIATGRTSGESRPKNAYVNFIIKY